MAERPQTGFTDRQDTVITDLLGAQLEGNTSVASGQFAKKCEDDKGTIVGAGPNCRGPLKMELGLYESFACRLELAIQCIDIAYEEVAGQLASADIVVQGGAKQVVYKENYYGPNSMGTYFQQKFDADTMRNCLQVWKTQCECKRCIHNYSDEEKQDDPNADELHDGDTSGDNEEVATGQKYNSHRLNTNSHTGPIQQVIGRFVVGGNIIWLSETESQTFETQFKAKDGTFIDVTDVITTIDMLIGLSVGEIHEVVRIWANDILIFNGAVTTDENGVAAIDGGNDGATGLTLAAMADSEYNLERLALVTPRITLYNGSHGQLPMYDEGDELSPGHRGLACILLENIDLALFGNGFPDLKFEVSSTPARDDITPHIIATPDSEVFDDIDPSYLDVDVRTGMIYTLGIGTGTEDNGVRIFDYNTLVERYNANGQGDDITSMVLMPSGHVFAETAGGKHIITPFKDMTRSTLATGSIAKGSRAVMGVGKIFDWEVPQLNQYITEGRVEYVFVADSTGDFNVVRFDYITDFGEILHTVNATASKSLQDAVLWQSGANLYFIEFLLPSAGAQSALTVDKYLVLDSESVVNQDDPPALTTFSVLAAEWGGFTAGVSVKQVLVDPNDGHFILFIDITGEDSQIIKINSDIGTTIWSITNPDVMPQYISVGPHSAQGVNIYYYWITDAGDVLRLDKNEGVIATVCTLAGQSLPGLGGAQFFDPTTQSITYITDDTPQSVVRFFPDLVVIDSINLQTVFDDVLSRTSMRSDSIDTHDLADIVLDGILIDSPYNVASEFDQLMTLFRCTVVDNGRRLTFLREESLTSTTLIEEEDYIGRDKAIARKIPFDRINAAEVSYYNINFTGLESKLQAVNLDQDKEGSYSPIQIQTAINIDSALIRNYAEQFLQSAALEQFSINGIFMPAMLALTPTDRIVVDDITYRIKSMVLSPDDSMTFDAVKHNQDGTVSAELAEIVLTSGPGRAVRTPFAPPIRPIVLFGNAFNDEDAAASVANNQVAYTAIDVAGRMAPEPVTFRIQIDEEDGDEYTSAVHQEGAHIGRLVTPATVPPYHKIFQLDTISTLVITFDHSDTADALSAVSDLDDLLSDTDLNLLIVGDEYIQFMDFAVAGDGKTVTFTNLLRGVLGTDFYIRVPRGYDEDGWFIRYQPVGTRCYYYTPTTFLPFNCDPQQTKTQPKVLVTFPASYYTGAPFVDYGQRADAGAARPYPPGGIKRTRVYGNAAPGYTTETLDGNIASWLWTWHPRRPIYQTSEQSLADPFPVDYPARYHVVSQAFEYVIDQYNIVYVRAQETILAAANTTSRGTVNVAQWQSNDDLDYLDVNFGADLSDFVLISQVNGSIMGQPAFYHKIFLHGLPDNDDQISNDDGPNG